jgi:AraC-like DNA-binding protein
MSFQQLISVIPAFEQVESRQTSHTIDCPMGRHVLIVVRRGHITIAAQGREPVVCSQGYACHSLHGPFDVHVPRTKQAEYIVITYRMIPENNPWTLFGPLSTMSEIKIHYMLDELIRTAEEIHTHSEAEEAAQQFRKRMILERILFIFLYESRMQQDEKSSSQSVEETLSYINEHYMLKLTLPLIARRAGMSEGHYTVLFKQHTGMTMSSYLRKLRIEKARQMFRQTRLPAKEIALTVGFSDYFHFSRVFKQETGCTPTDFMKSELKI